MKEQHAKVISEKDEEVCMQKHVLEAEMGAKSEHELRLQGMDAEVREQCDKAEGLECELRSAKDGIAELLGVIDDKDGALAAQNEKAEAAVKAHCRGLSETDRAIRSLGSQIASLKAEQASTGHSTGLLFGRSEDDVDDIWKDAEEGSCLSDDVEVEQIENLSRLFEALQGKLHWAQDNASRHSHALSGAISELSEKIETLRADLRSAWQLAEQLSVGEAKGSAGSRSKRRLRCEVMKAISSQRTEPAETSDPGEQIPDGAKETARSWQGNTIQQLQSELSAAQGEMNALGDVLNRSVSSSRDRNYGFPVDMWSLACVFCEMATGQTLFLPSTASDIDQLLSIIGICGTSNPGDWHGLEDLPGFALIRGAPLIPCHASWAGGWTRRCLVSSCV